MCDGGGGGDDDGDDERRGDVKVRGREVRGDEKRGCDG